MSDPPATAHGQAAASATARKPSIVPIKVIYVMGAGRSGSTALGILLGNANDTVCAGELDSWPRRNGEPNGDGAELTAFWEEVRARIPASDVHTGSELHKQFERPGSLVRRKNPTAYREFNRQLYLSVAATAGVSTVIDTSHYPMRRKNLEGLQDIDIYTIRLVRDPRSVVASFGKRDVRQKPKNPVEANLYLWVVHLLSAMVYRGISSSRRMTLRYEDLVAYPHRVLERLTQSLELDFSGVDITALKTGPVFQGNRMRVEETVSLVHALSPAPRRRITALMQWPWLRSYGYRRTYPPEIPE